MQSDRYFVGGAEAFIAPYLADGTLGALFSLGDTDVFAPSIAPITVERYAATSGIRTLSARRVTETKEEYTLSNFDVKVRRNMALFMAGDLKTFTQAATPITAVAHDCFGPGTVIALRDGTGKHIAPVTSVESVGAGVAGTDYIANPDDLKFGIIRIPEGSTLTESEVAISFTPAAITDEQRLIYPLSVPVRRANVILVQKEGGPDGAVDFIMLRNGGDAAANNSVGFDCIVTPANASFSATEFSNFELNLSAVADTTNPGKPVGRMLIPVGGF